MSTSRRDSQLARLINPSALSGGFTLLEILVAMTLVALVTVIAVTAFRLTIMAWGRITDEGESRQIQAALPVLLENQLAARVKVPIFGNAKVNPALYFCGDENSLSFLTAYAPRGSLLQGMSWVGYQFDPARKTVFIYERVVTRTDDMDLTGQGARNIAADEPVSRIQGISGFSFAYTSEVLYEPDDFRQWQNFWNCGADSIGFPVGLILKMTIGEGPRASAFTWVYRLGDQVVQTNVGGSNPQRSLTPFRRR